MRCFHGRRITGTVMRRVVRFRALIRSAISQERAWSWSRGTTSFTRP